MRIGIMTLPLDNNYGGILQAYALMKTLQKMGHDVWLINSSHGTRIKWRYPLSLVKRSIFRYVFGKDVVVQYEKRHRFENQNFRDFINRNIQPLTKKIYIPRELNKLVEYKLDAYIVGSDQVWREWYSRKFIKNYFLDFVQGDEIKKISYAASFGVDNWEYDESTTKKLLYLASKFNAISVREDSAVALCRDYLGVKAEWLLDPTLLLHPEDYQDLIRTCDYECRQGAIGTYILDKSREKSDIIKSVAEVFDDETFSIGDKDCNKHNIYPPVIDWVHGLSSAGFVVTDSFHGCVFSILFNKPFLAIGNSARGMARFTSLLKLFGLESRLVANVSDVTNEKVLGSINWGNVNKILNEKRQESFVFLEKSLA